MKIIVTGSLGHIGKPLTTELVEKGHTVTVISSNPEKQPAIEALGATAAIGSLEDADFLSKTFTGADVVYTMVPPVNFFNPDLDLKAHCLTLANNYKQAIEESGVKRVIHLSSIGAHMDKHSGMILLHRQVEDTLNTLSDVAITFIRPTAFYYNLLGFVAGIKNTGMMSSNYGGEDLVSWVSPVDIAAAIAQEISTPLTGKKVLYVGSEELTCNQVAAILGAAIGKPDLQWITIPTEEFQARLESFGMPTAIAGGLAEMNAAIHTGELFADYFRHRPQLRKVKLTTFAKEFAAIYAQN